MLALHINPDVEAASRTKGTIRAETDFIIDETGMDAGKTVLDLGCGPGLYVREFAKTGAKVTGIDFSARSIEYAQTHVRNEYESTEFIKMNYLDIQYENVFDVVTLIYYDFCVLDPREQETLLANIHRALKDNGVFVFDVVSENRKTRENCVVSIHAGGFWSPDPYLEIMNTYLYENPKAESMHYVIVGEDGGVRTIRLYHRLFGLNEITSMLKANNLMPEKVYRNLSGETPAADSETYGIFA